MVDGGTVTMVMDSIRLDDHTYTDLVEKARALIPTLHPEWTNQNPSDPGITLIELFAWLTETLLYRVNLVPDTSYWTFVKLLTGSADPAANLSPNLESAIQITIRGLRERYRAVTCEDFEDLAARVWGTTSDAAALGAQGIVRRAACVAGRNLELATPAQRLEVRRAHVSLIVVPEAALDTADPQPSSALRQALRQWLDPRRLLTTIHHVVGPEYVRIAVTARLVRNETVSEQSIRTAARDAVRRFMHPVLGGPDGTGWPFGRDVYISEVYEVLARVRGIVGVSDVALTPTDQATPIAPDRSIRVEPHQLVAARVEEASFTIDMVTPGAI
jgi:hypothetical protein